MNERFPEMDCVAHGFIAHTYPLQDGTGYDPSIREHQVLQIALELEKLLSGTGAGRVQKLEKRVAKP